MVSIDKIFLSLFFILILLLLFLWPIYFGISIAKGEILPANLSHKLGFCGHCSQSGTTINSLFLSAILLGFWWTMLGSISFVSPIVAKLIFLPFRNHLTHRSLLIITIISFCIFILFTGAMILSYTEALKFGIV